MIPDTTIGYALTDEGNRISDGWAERMGARLGAEERGTVARRLLPNPKRQVGFKTTEQMREAAARGGAANAKKRRKR